MYQTHKFNLHISIPHLTYYDLVQTNLKKQRYSFKNVNFTWCFPAPFQWGHINRDNYRNIQWSFFKSEMFFFSRWSIKFEPFLIYVDRICCKNIWEIGIKPATESVRLLSCFSHLLINSTLDLKHTARFVLLAVCWFPAITIMFGLRKSRRDWNDQMTFWRN